MKPTERQTMSDLNPRHGMRHFECDECGHVWSEPSRDRFSPSGVDCIKCEENWCHPVGSSFEPSLKVDRFGNLTE